MCLFIHDSTFFYCVSSVCFINTFILLKLQLRANGFVHIDALDPSKEMLDVAKKEGLYENYFVDFLNEKQLPIPPGNFNMSQAMRKCVLCHMRTTKAQISLRIRVV